MPQSNKHEPSWPLEGTGTVLVAIAGVAASLAVLGAVLVSTGREGRVLAVFLFAGGECVGIGVLLCFATALAVTWLADRRRKAEGRGPSAAPYQFGIRAVLAVATFLAILLAANRSILIFCGAESLRSAYRIAGTAAGFLVCFFSWTAIGGAGLLALALAWRKSLAVHSARAGGGENRRLPHPGSKENRDAPEPPSGTAPDLESADDSVDHGSRSDGRLP
ncbi:MAG: hypothetical protein HUU20_00970 [Pirellulales bacterium]|nr:hypothetical protein [Pirellulales bacterium]